MSSSASWMTRPVSVTSTFRDMQAERDWLREHVFPALKERLRQRHCHLEAIDLRWGVETVGEGETEAREILVLKVCLAEIERSRPFLIALLGDRYGWVPPEGRMKRAVEEAGFETEVEGKSVTALEIEYGVLDSADQRRRSRFYFREPLPHDAMSPSAAAEFREADSDAARKLAALKSRIETEMPDRVRHYAAQWDGEHARVTGLEAFGRMVLEDLWADLCEEISPLDDRSESTWEDDERAAFDEFVEECERDFRGRAEITDELVTFALGPGTEWGLSLTGGPGSGKSALMAHVYRKLEGKALVLANAAGTSLRSTSVDMLLRRWIGELAEFLGEPDRLTENPSPDELEQAFSRLMYQAAERTRVVVLLDALNQFEATTRAAHMTWLPKMWHENARLIATAIPGTQSEALQSRPGVEARDLPPLSKPEAEEIAAAICAQYHRTLNPDVLAVLTAKQTDGEAACGNPLWLELALEELNLLDEDDFRRADRDFEGRPDERLHQLLLHVAEDMPADIEGMYGWLLKKTEQVWGEAWARGFANLIAVSRGGWREMDLERLLPMVTGGDWDPARFAGLRRSFRAHLVQRGLQGQWDFFHAQARKAVLDRNLPDPISLHTLIADHLLSLPADDPLRESETMFHLIGADDKPRAARYYASDLTDGALAGATQVLADEVLAGEAQDPNPGLEWLVSLPQSPGLEAREIWSVAEHLLIEVKDAVTPRGMTDTSLAFLGAAQDALMQLVSSDPANPQWQQDLALSLERIGDVHMAQGDQSAALDQYLRALDIRRRLAAADVDRLEWRLQLSVSFGNVGDLLMALGNLPMATECHRAALGIAEGVAASSPGSAGAQRRVVAAHTRLGEATAAQGDVAGALGHYHASLSLARRMAESSPANPDLQSDLAVVHALIGDAAMAQGNLSAALVAYSEGLQIAEGLAAYDPANIVWQRDLSACHSRAGDVLMEMGDPAGAMKEFLADLSIAERLAASDPANAGYQRDLSVSHTRVGDVLFAQDDLDGAMRSYQATMAIAERLVASDPANIGWQRDVAITRDTIGDVLTAQGDPAGALEEYRAALDMRARVAAQVPHDAQLERTMLSNQEKIASAMVALGDPAALEEAHHCVAMAERLAASDPTSPQGQWNLWVTYMLVAQVLQSMGDATAVSWWRKTYEQLSIMKQGGMHLSAQNERLLERLRAYLEG